MTNRMRIGSIVIGLCIVALVAWVVQKDQSIVSDRGYPGFVNRLEVDVPDDVRAQWEIQKRTAEALLIQDPDNLGLIQSLAVFNKSLGNLALARRYAELYVEKNTVSPAGWVILGDIAVDMEDYKTAEAAYIKSLSVGVDSAVFEKIERLWRNHIPERYADIEQLWEDAIRLDTQRDTYLVKLARWYAENNRWQEAADNMRIVAERNPSDANTQQEYQEYRLKARE